MSFFPSGPTKRYRKILCPDIGRNVYYQAKDTFTGEMFECADVAQLLKRIALEPNHTWMWTSHYEAPKLTDEELAAIAERDRAAQEKSER